MELSLDQIQEIVKEPKSKEVKSRAARNERMLELHTEPRLTRSETSSYLNEFLTWVRDLLPSDKAQVFENLLTYPLVSTGVVGEVYKVLSKVYQGRNQFRKYTFDNTELSDDWEYYRVANLKEPDIWTDKGFKKMQTSINSFLVVDLPREQTTELPEPYFYWVDITAAHDFLYKDDRLQYFMFVAEDKMIVLDDKYYRVYGWKDSKLSITPEYEAVHTFGVTPARFFWTDAVSEKLPEVKSSPVSPELGNLNWYLFWAISKRQTDLYSAYPIYYGYEQECDYKGPDGHYCSKGFLRDRRNVYIHYDGHIAKCPVCSVKRLAGAGSFVETPYPMPNEPEVNAPVGLLAVDKGSLEYNVAEVDRLRGNIMIATTGYFSETESKEAYNEMQVESSFEARKAIMMWLKKNFEAAEQWVDTMICTARYGEHFTGCSINLGTEWYLFSLSELQKMYKDAKDGGASMSHLDMLQDQIIDSEYKDNPEVRERMKILMEIEPYRHLSIKEVYDYRETLNADEVNIKMNFSSLVAQFERDNTPVTEFGLNLSYRERVNKINQTIRSYGKTSQAA